MNKTFVIQWTSKVNGRSGRGTKLFDRDEAERLAIELNGEYPQIQHETVEVSSVREEPVPFTAPAPVLSAA